MTKVAAFDPANTRRRAVVFEPSWWYFEDMMKSHLLPETGESPRFDAVVEAADHLTLEEQQTLIEVVSRRLAERRRADIAGDVEEAQREFQSGALQPATPREIMKDILS